MQLKNEIGRLFLIISEQERLIEEGQKQIPTHHTILLNHIKNRKDKIKINIDKALECLKLSQNSNMKSENYNNMNRDLEVHQKFQKEMINKISSQNAVSGKSLKTLNDLQQSRID